VAVVTLVGELGQRTERRFAVSVPRALFLDVVGFEALLASSAFRVQLTVNKEEHVCRSTDEAIGPEIPTAAPHLPAHGATITGTTAATEAYRNQSNRCMGHLITLAT